MASAGYNWQQAAENLEHRQIALQMRAEGHTLAQIGEVLGITRQTVGVMIRRTIKRVEGDAVHELRTVWNARYEADYHALDVKAAAGDVDAISARTRIGAQVALLNGLNAPTQTHVTGDQEIIVRFSDGDAAQADSNAVLDAE